VAAFDGGTVSSDTGALLLGRTDEAIGLIVSWCEQNAVDYVFGLARNSRLVRSIGAVVTVSVRRVKLAMSEACAN